MAISLFPNFPRRSQSLKQRRLKRLGLLSLGGLSALLTALPLAAAEKISFVYGPFYRSLSIQSLEKFATTGEVNPDLAFYFWIAKVDEAAKAKFREALVKRAEIDPLLPSQFFYSDIGEDLLTRMGRYIGSPRGINGMYGLRSTLILSTLDPEGMSLLSILQNYPTDIWVNLENLLILRRTIDRVVEATTYFTDELKQQAAQEANHAPPVDFAQLPDLRQPGPFGVDSQRWQLTDASRNRQFYVDVYRPQRWRSGQAPVLILSHGLSSRPEDFARSAEHMASYGYVVALPQHPGSDHLQAQALKTGLSRQVFLTSEFIDRPQDISYVIDELERRNLSEFEGRLNLQSVGVAGHSFGGYGVMAVAGATIDFEFLEEECKRLAYPNTSLLLSCRALSLPRQEYNFRDDRVTAVFAANPVNYSIFGPEGLAKIQIPVMIGSGSYDPAAPAVFEQARSFPSLTTPFKYLALAEGQAHVDFSQLDAGVTQAINSATKLTLPAPDLIHDYASALRLAFFEVHLLDNPDYRPYLQSSYAAYLSRDQQFKLLLVSAASDPALKQAIAEWQAENPPIALPESWLTQ